MWNLHTKAHLCFYKNSRIQSFAFIRSKLVYFKKHLSYHVYDQQESKFALPLNVSYRRQTIKFAVGAITEPFLS